MAADSDRIGIQEEKLTMMSGSFYIAKYGDLGSQGEDSHFICEEMQTIGVADGVGGWRMRSVDAGIYARQLMNNSLLATPLRLIHTVSHESLNVFSYVDAACCNIGDSGFMVIRQGAAIQITNSAILFQFSISVIKVAVEAGDIIIAGTDGLFDNLYESQISEIAVTGIEQSLHPGDVAWQVAQQAYNISMDKKAVTPFTQDSKMAGKWRIGGKRDDITVIVSCILHT
ncbi:Detected protein of unknown function [Hibiscus syriacus]|uniref:Protein phosphatase n=1 Tax=Hibiscus syriacus TaxID=106335 RepID=A0A6A3B133_HIBSY|nr:Detected protein of unknown function [Hibiscus syriacus]